MVRVYRARVFHDVLDPPPPDRRFVVPLGVLLGGSLLAALRLPGLGVGLSNLLIAAAGLTLLGLHRDDLWRCRRRLAPPVLAAVGVWVWSWVAALTGPLPEVALRSSAKGAVYGLALLGALALFASPRRRPAAVGGVLAFLVVLALFGVVEAAFPQSLPFLLLRTDDSLSITPRVASLLPWPNQFGVAMVLALVLVEDLARRGLLGPRAAWALRLLLLVQVAQSGSRNAWLVLAATLTMLALGRVTPGRRAAGLAALFAAVAVTLPVPARQLGLHRGSWLPAANLLIAEPRGWSPSLSPIGMSASLRSKLWREAAAEIRRHPVSGLGPNVFQAVVGPRVMGEPGFNAHNLVLEAWVALGTVGLGLVGIAVALALACRPPGRGAGGLPLAVLLLAQVMDCFTHDPTMVVLMVLSGAAAWFREASP